jgi:Zn-dependent protease with chaperone function
MSWLVWSHNGGGRVVDREWLLAVFTIAIGGSVLSLGGLRSARRYGEQHAFAVEDGAWTAVLTPFFAALVVVAAVLGWALVEPEDAEVLPPVWFVVASPLAMIWLRAVMRAVRGALARPGRAAAETYGLVHPRVRLAPEFEAVLDGAAIEAARAHETAHVRHRDPLRIWFAQLITDLQSTAAARQRFAHWLVALEHARDDEARHGGVDGADLAAAVIAAIRIQTGARLPIGARLTGADLALRARIARLLGPLSPIEHVRRGRGLSCWMVGFVGAMAVGALFGERLVRLLTGATGAT